MFVAYRIHPVVETQGAELGDITCARFASLSEAQRHICEWEEGKTSYSGVEGKRIIWTLYGVHPEENGVSTDEAIADRDSFADAFNLLFNIIGPIQGVSQGYYQPANQEPSDAAQTDLLESWFPWFHRRRNRRPGGWR